MEASIEAGFGIKGVGLSFAVTLGDSVDVEISSILSVQNGTVILAAALVGMCAGRLDAIYN